MDDVRRIADAVLYEGYMLWPYRRSALKNTRRWTVGGIYPPAHSAEHPHDRCDVVPQGPVRGGEDLGIRARFLHVVRRQAMQDGEPVDEATVDGERVLSWDEATEREFGPGTFAIPEGRVADSAVVRSWHGIAGAIDVHVRELGYGV